MRPVSGTGCHQWAFGWGDRAEASEDVSLAECMMDRTIRKIGRKVTVAVPEFAQGERRREKRNEVYFNIERRCFGCRIANFGEMSQAGLIRGP
jgi:hypothetical protein